MIGGLKQGLVMPEALLDDEQVRQILTDAGCFPEQHTHYELRRILDLAFHQSATGKGQERHGSGKRFEDQPIMNIARMVGLGGHTYQVCKKAQEATTMASRGNAAGAKAELLGAIVYAAAAYLLVEEEEKSREN